MAKTPSVFDTFYAELERTIALNPYPDSLAAAKKAEQALKAAETDDQKALVHVTVAEWLIGHHDDVRALVRLNDAQRLAISRATRARVMLAKVKAHAHRGDFSATVSSLNLLGVELCHVPPGTAPELRSQYETLVMKLAETPTAAPA